MITRCDGLAGSKAGAIGMPRVAGAADDAWRQRGTCRLDSKHSRCARGLLFVRGPEVSSACGEISTGRWLLTIGLASENGLDERQHGRYNTTEMAANGTLSIGAKRCNSGNLRR